MQYLLDSLTSLGIQKKQAKVYLACLELGSATVQELAEESNVKRTSIYNFLEDLKNLGLVSEIKKGSKLLLVAENPKTVISKAEKRIEQARNNLPEFLSIFNAPANKPKVKFHQGLEGLKTAYADYAVQDGEIFGFTDYEKMFETLPADFLWSAGPEARKKNNTHFYCIAKNGPKGKLMKSKDKEQLRQTKLVKDINFETEINIYQSKVSLISFKKPYTAVIIEDQAIAQTMKSIWDLVWNNLE
ncbi:hypothetical protein HN858_03710 [Candidatus Falkowbacteria bacterium]|jgi:HTH-type transcriptional regulator, sugar sensing transcriptional regulator|nr:hypothetical protein [Candidatus Falkowbacteria bacterium]MBT5503705.1 hypothetical protein [Candidatus Falkowbacteria bacterium]MBT6573815.1 hypothetical protein [Candidatus Falkowbacteria bacterium]MBT7348757.1 hypothetical protein [Candidatus Falkowbacteria bacterium]MBT7500547.1 hypothetical protein [Candidatus Falkowbacteria bacterium]